MVKMPRSQKQLTADRKRSTAMKGKRPSFLKGKKSSRRSVPKSKNNSHRKKETTIPLSIVLPVLSPVVKSITFDPGTGRNGVFFARTAEGAKQTVRSLVRSFSGYDLDRNIFEFEPLMQTYGPLVVGVLAHKFLGGPANRILAANKVPLLRI